MLLGLGFDLVGINVDEKQGGIMSIGQRTQNQNLIRIQTVLGDDALFVVYMNATLSMSALSNFSLNVYSDVLHDIQPKELIGTEATIAIINEGGEPHYYNGYITSLVKDSPAESGQPTNYFLTIRPWLNFLAHDSDCRIFQNNTVLDVINKIFEPYKNIGNYTISVGKKYSEKRYQVQYNETNLDFFNRICHYSGLAYYFTYKNGSHHLHIIDDASPLSSTLPNILNYQPGTQSRDHLTVWQRDSRYATGNVEQRSYNYKTPSNLITSAKACTGEVSDVPRVNATTYYQYIEDFNGFSDISTHTASRVSQITSGNNFVRGRGDCRYLQVASCFSVLPVPATSFFPDKGKEFTLTSMSISAHNKGHFDVSFIAAPKGELVSPECRPISIPGLQTAVVSGPKGEDIYTDDLGRIKVQFHWDRQGKKDQNTTCYLRVMQSFAGPSFGSQFTPRIGQEVVVAFENGNPDRPFVTGALYHPENSPPYARHNGTRNGIRTRSTKGGSVVNCNELYFEDKKGKEEIYFQAEKDLNTLVKNNQNIRINNNKAQQVVNNETRYVGKDMTVKVGDTLIIDAGTKIQLQVGNSVIKMTSSGINISSSGNIEIDGNKVEINC